MYKSFFLILTLLFASFIVNAQLINWLPKQPYQKVEFTTQSEPDYTLYPNPVSDFLTISFGAKNVNGKIEIHDMLGKLILTQDLESSSGLEKIDVCKFENGLYYVVFYNESNRERQ